MIERHIFQTLTAVAVAGVLGLAGCASRQASTTAPAAEPGKPAPAAAAADPQLKPQPARTGKVLVLGSQLPPGTVHEVIGTIEVFSRSYGGIGESYRMLGDKGREVGANAVIDARVWLAPSFPVAAAPHGKGIAVRVRDEKKLQEVGGTGGRWE
jgi:hypothetical protein